MSEYYTFTLCPKCGVLKDSRFEHICMYDLTPPDTGTEIQPTIYYDTEIRLKVYTGGTFDVPHLGHYNFFKQVKEIYPNSQLIVALNTDEFVERYKGAKPLFSFSEREKFIRNIDFVDKVVTNFGDEDSRKAIIYHMPNIIVIGNDWLEKDYCKQMGFTAEWLREYKITLSYIPYTDGISTTEIKRRLNA